MKNDIIKCLNCGKTFKDDTKEASNTYQWQGQDSRTNNFKNMCPFCYGTNTENTHETTTRKQKFIYKAPVKGEERHKKGCSKKIKRPNLNNDCIAKEVLGWRQPFNAKETKRGISKVTCIETFVENTGGTFDTSPVKPFTPIELMGRKLKAQRKELLSPPDNFKRYRGWRYDRRLKHGNNN